MNDKKRNIIEAAMRLFATKGFHSTSIQEIADHSEVSKGSVYIHFRSKEDILLGIHHYYYESVKGKMQTIEHDGSPKDLFAKQIFVYFNEMVKQKSFITMLMRENFSISEEVDAFILKMRQDEQRWYESSLLAIYDDEITPYLYDGAAITEGLMKIYMKILIFDGAAIDLNVLSHYIVRRVDDAILGLMETKETPMLTKDMVNIVPFFQHDNDNFAHVKQQLQDSKQIVMQLIVEEQEQKALLTTIEVLMKEADEKDPKKAVFQGMLSNFKPYKELNAIRLEIAKRLNIHLVD
jgi:AcrR family transcriptional regulator